MTIPSKQALFRYSVLSQVLSRILAGETRAEAIRHVAAIRHATFDGSLRTASLRGLYRWLAAYERGGVEALDEEGRRSSKDKDLPIPLAFVEFLKKQKDLDPKASIPEIIDRAKLLGILDPRKEIDRTTVWRVAKRMKIPVIRRKSAKTRDARRFAYPHRMDMVLCDGKHFRAGATRMKRLAFFFLDDATRLGLHVVVGTTENKDLFLRGLYETIRRRGLMSILYIDRGSGFIAADTVEVLKNLHVLLIHGEASYPEGHGKIERFNQTALARVLRGLDRRPDVDPLCSALELRLQHFLEEIYNESPHESLEEETPASRFSADSKPLRFPENDQALRAHFVVHIRRRVSADNVVSLDNIDYEVPRGHAGEILMVKRGVLDRRISVVHQGRLVTLSPVDLHANARAQRAKGLPEPEVDHPLPKSAADLAFDREYRPVVGEDGGFLSPKEKNDP